MPGNWKRNDKPDKGKEHDKPDHVKNDPPPTNDGKTACPPDDGCNDQHASLISADVSASALGLEVCLNADVGGGLDLGGLDLDIV